MIFSQRYKIHWISRWDYSINSNLLDREFSVKWWDSLKINKIISQMYEDYPLLPTVGILGILELIAWVMVD